MFGVLLTVHATHLPSILSPAPGRDLESGEGKYPWAKQIGRFQNKISLKTIVLIVSNISPIRHVRHIPLDHLEYKKWEVETSDSNQPTPASNLKSTDKLDSSYHSTLDSNVFFHRVLCSLHSCSSRPLDPLASHRPCASHPIPSNQGPPSYRHRCRILLTTLFNPWIAFDH